MCIRDRIPHGDTSGKALGIAMSDELSGDLTLAFSLLTISDRELDGTFDSRCPLCANEENVLHAAKRKMAESGFDLDSDSMRPAHHVPEDSGFVTVSYTHLDVYKRQDLNRGGYHIQPYPV